MSVHFKRRRSVTVAAPVAPVAQAVTARELLNPTHPAHEGLVKFCRGKELTRRKAAEFLRFPQFRALAERLVAEASVKVEAKAA